MSGEVGIGAGVIADGKPLLGSAGYAGEAGHMLVNPDGRECRCGAIGCWETEAGEAALLRRAGLEDGADGAHEVVERAIAGDGTTLRAVAEVGRWLGLGIGDLINLYNPDLVVLGGLYRLLFDPLEAPVLEGVRSRALGAPLELARIERSGLALGRSAHRRRGARAFRSDRRPGARRGTKRERTRGRRWRERTMTEGAAERRRTGWPTFLVGAVLGVAMVILGSVIVRITSDDEPACEPVAADPGWSVPRRWDEVTLDAIRRALPAPTVHARNLFHVSAAMWDAWAAYDPRASGYFIHEKHTAGDIEAARNEAISYAAYGVLEHRYQDSVGRTDSLLEFNRLMEELCYPIDVTTTEGDSPAALGNRVAAAVIEYGLGDGSNEAGGYASDYQPVNPPLAVAASGPDEMKDPNRWQPLQLEQAISQNGIPIDDAVQQFIGPHWGRVAGFALLDAGAEGLPMDPGPPPRLGDPVSDQAYKDAAVEVIRISSELDPGAGVMLDISPGTIGANPLGTNDGHGHPVDPETGEPYAPDIVNLGDYGRTLAEFWADGPHSETPPGHWNVIANEVSDAPGFELRIGGTGPAVDRLEWDVKLYFALNGAVHDAAVAAWGAKGYYDSVRPISMIRYMGGLGQSSDPDAPAYDPEGLPLVPGLIEVITRKTTAPGERHEALAGHEGEIAIYAWAGTPADPQTQTSGAAWILATEWVPYQQPTFVTPAFASYVSGHSTFSRSAAEVLTAITGSEYFPGGLSGWTIPAGSLDFESGPMHDVTLQWATYFDAADQAGISRLYGGIHIAADDFAGRRMGSACGLAAWAKAQRYYDGLVDGHA